MKYWRWIVPIVLLLILAIVGTGLFSIYEFQKKKPEKAVTSMVRLFNDRGDWIKGGEFFQNLLRKYIHALMPEEQPWTVSLYLSENQRPDYLVVAIGDSLTAGLQLDEKQRYVYFLERLIAYHMPGKTVKVVNAGVPGNTIIDLEKRLDRDLISLQPDLVVMGLGFNDARILAKAGDKFPTLVPLKQHVKTYNRVVKTILEKTEANVLLFSPTPLADYYGSDLGGDITIPQMEVFDKYHLTARAVAEKRQCGFADTYDALTDSPFKNKSFMKDGLHPNPIGNLLMVRQMFEAWCEMESVEPKAPFLILVSQAIGKIHLKQSNILFHGTFDTNEQVKKWKQWLKSRK